MIRKPTSGDSEQREREAERARKHSKLSASGPAEQGSVSKKAASKRPDGSVEGDSAHGAIPRRDIESEREDE
jgi:hypothetical protein